MASDKTADLKAGLAVLSQANSVNTKETVTAIQGSMLFANDWVTMLMSAPTVVKSLGTCFVASSSSMVADIQLKPPEKGFQLIRDRSLRANLVRCGNLGHMAFIEADTSMSGIQLGSATVEDSVRAILGIILDPNAPVKTLMRHTTDLKETAETCLEYALKVDKRFDEWLMFVMELEEACTGHQSASENDLMQSKINLLVGKTRLDHTKLAADQAEDAVNTLKKELDTTSKAFKKASDDYPDGWEIVGQQIVSGLADTFNQVVAKALPVLMAAVSPVEKINLFAGSAVGTVGSVIDMVDGDAGGRSEGGNRSAGGGGGGTHPGQPVPSTAGVRATNMADPAYSQVGKDIVFFDALQDLLTSGEKDGVNWDKARGKGTPSQGGEDPRSSSSFLRTMLDEARQSFRRLATAEEPSVKYMKSLEVVAGVATGLHDQVLKARNAGYKLPSADDPLVEGWKEKFDDQYMEARKIFAAAKAIPGNPPNGFPMASPQAVDPGTAVDPIRDPSLAKTLIGAAQFQLTVAEEAYLQSMKTYQRSTEVFVEQKTRMAEISAELTRLTSESLNLTEVLKILQSSIQLIGRMKHDITNLVTFFKGLSILIEHVVDRRVQTFVKHLRDDFSDDDDGEVDSQFRVNPTAKIGDFRLVDAEREFLYRTIVTIRSYFDLFADVARVWIKMSVKNVTPGLRLVDRLRNLSGNKNEEQAEMQAKVAELEAWSDAAVSDIEVEVGERQKQIKDGLQARFNKFEALTKALPPPPEVKKAITEGTQAVAATTAEVIKKTRDLMF